ncbi:hypothetical protein J8273_4879 [Carpediemonas membranifera]|uniref:Uncharacterized protein n=1 Tax=Carpediemonas membranifera TaxID=201153 RepID=A0A8J6E9S8_9EUKA|nr:hypothetical protein J8273_4879 [Carpediemonas membranifera]|eukprot:KAG9393760.1 hypothetical protein J8273_4879 [Carpediemonas membranifera]
MTEPVPLDAQSSIDSIQRPKRHRTKEILSESVADFINELAIEEEEDDEFDGTYTPKSQSARKRSKLKGRGRGRGGGRGGRRGSNASDRVKYASISRGRGRRSSLSMTKNVDLPVAVGKPTEIPDDGNSGIAMLYGPGAGEIVEFKPPADEPVLNVPEPFIHPTLFASSMPDPPSHMAHLASVPDMDFALSPVDPFSAMAVTESNMSMISGWGALSECGDDYLESDILSTIGSPGDVFPIHERRMSMGIASLHAENASENFMSRVEQAMCCGDQ